MMSPQEGTLSPITVRRGEIWAIQTGSDLPMRYCLVVSDNRINTGKIREILTLSITARYFGYPHYVEIEPKLSPEERGPWYARCDDPHAVPKKLLDHRVGEVAPAVMQEINSWLKYFFAL